MSYFKLRPIIRRYKEQMLDKYGVVVKKVKWNKGQLDLMEKCLDFDLSKYEGIHTINIGNLEVKDV